MKYDERQEFVRVRAYRFAFMTLLAGVFAWGLLHEAAGWAWTEDVLGVGVNCACLACAGFIYCVVHGACLSRRSRHDITYGAVNVCSGKRMYRSGLRGAVDRGRKADGVLEAGRWAAVADGGTGPAAALLDAAPAEGQGGAVKNLRLKAARAPMGLSQQALADAGKVSRQTVNAIEQGDYNPTVKLCVAICRTLHKTLDELFWEE